MSQALCAVPSFQRSPFDEAGRLSDEITKSGRLHLEATPSQDRPSLALTGIGIDRSPQPLHRRSL